VKRQIGESHLIPLLFSGPGISAEELLELGNDIVVKLNNDSRSAEFIEENTPEKASEISEREISVSVAINGGIPISSLW